MVGTWTFFVGDTWGAEARLPHWYFSSSAGSFSAVDGDFSAQDG